MSRVDQHLTTAVIDGEPWGVFDTFEGGEADSEETRYRPGGMAPQKSLGGRATVGTITIGRLLELETDWARVLRLHETRTGKAWVTVSRQPLDIDGNPYGEPQVKRGKLKTVTLPDSDSESDDPAVWTMTITPEG